MKKIRYFKSFKETNLICNDSLGLTGDLDFCGENGVSSTHLWHSFPAKFPPQLPRMFIRELTLRGDIVIDPMMGSGTTLIESVMLERNAIGCDIDP